MKKIFTAIICLVLSLFVFAGCGNSTELTISIGDSKKENDAVSVLLKYNDTWKSGEKIFTVNYGHESDAVLADEYSVSFCDVDPLFENSVTLKEIYSFTKADLEDRTVDNGRFSGKEGEIIAGDLEDYLPQGEGTLSVYIVLSSTDTDFGNITTFASHEIEFQWQDGAVKIVD